MQPIVCDPAKRRSHRNAVLRELRELQELAMEDMRNPDTTAMVRAQLMRAYVAVQEMRRVEKMKPNPKPIDVSTLRKPKPVSSRSLQPLDPTASQVA